MSIDNRIHIIRFTPRRYLVPALLRHLVLITENNLSIITENGIKIVL